MKATKITAFAMAAVMSASVAATTALSVSAADAVTVSSTTLNWGTRDSNGTTYDLTNVVLYKTDFSDVSMSNGAIASSKISFDGANYTLTINFQKVTKSVTVGDLTLTNATAVVTDVDALDFNKKELSTTFTEGKDGDGVAVITIPKDTFVDSIPEFTYGDDDEYTVDPEYGITLNFQTSFDKSYLNWIPEMTSPSAEMTFSISTVIATA